MKKILSIAISTILTVLIYTGCSKEQMAQFQKNDQEPEYSLLKLFDGFPALHSAIDSLNSQNLNAGLGEMLINGYETPQFLRDATGLVEAPFLVPMIGELHGILNIMMDPAAVHYDDPTNDDGGYYDTTNGSIDRLAQFYAALDQVVGNTNLSTDILAMATQVVDYLVKTKTPAEIESDMGNMMKVAFYDGEMYTGTKVNLGAGTYNLTDSSMNDMVSSLEVPIGMKVTLYQNIDKGGSSWTFTSSNRSLADDSCNNVASSVVIEYDLTKLAKLLGKVTMSCDYPMWVNSSNIPPANRDQVGTSGYTTNTDLGNGVKGLIKLLYGLNTIAASDPSVRTTIDNMILQDLPGLLNNDTQAKAKVETLVQNLAKYFAHDEVTQASTYDTSRDYYNDPAVSGHNSGYYVNASLKETLREILPNAMKLFIKDNEALGENDYSIIKYSDGHSPDGLSPIETLIVALRKLYIAGIDFSTVDMEQSLKLMMTKNGFGVNRTDSGAFKLSYLDHLVYTISAGYNFGFKTRVDNPPSQGGEPANNDFTITSLGDTASYNHGESTNGVITVNDSMYSLTSSYLLLPEANSYNLALIERRSQGTRIWRSSTDNTYTGIRTDGNRFYLGYDYPVLLLLPTGMAGDGGIPNGGKQALVPAADTTSGNDYKTYFPKEADGKGILNTSEFLMGWLARACWDGQGPYYYADPSATQQSIGGHTGYVYYKPNGEIYALVDKSGSSWVYYYPVSGDDVADDTGQRANRYRDEIKSDYFLAQEGSNNKYAAPPMNENGTENERDGEAVRWNLLGQCIERANKYYLSASAGKNPSYFRLKEKIAQTNPVRACASQEEALYRNFQWLMLEKKFVFTIPMAINSGVLCSMMSVKSAAFVVIEGNGVLGLATAKKGSHNGYWVLKGDEGTENVTGNNPNYGDSYELGDGRVMVFSTFQDLILSQVSPPQIFSGLLGDGYVLPDAVGRNIAPVIRLGFLQSDLVASNDKTSTWNTAYTNRNRILSLFIALTGSLHDGTYYDPPTSGSDHNYNYSGNHKYPMRHVLEGVFGPLAKPYFRRFTSPSPRWVQRVNNDNTTSNTLVYFTPNGNINNYLPKESLRSLVSILTGSTDTGTDGLLPILADHTHMVSRLMSLLQQLGDPRHDMARANLALGLEQLMTSLKINKSQAINAGYDSQLDHYSNYQWIFNKRDEDVSLEDFLGFEGAFRASDNWSSFEKFYDFLGSLMGGSRDVRQNLVNIANAILAQPLTENEVHGLLYTAGKLFARHTQVYPGGVWQYHGYDHGASDTYDQLVDILAYIPQVHDIMKTSGGTGEKYNRMLQNVDFLLKDRNSILHYMLENMTTPYSVQSVVEDLDRFLDWSIISDPNSPLWDDLVLMLDAMADMNDPRVDISVIIKNLGFQAN